MDIATEDLSHLEVIGNTIVMLNKGVKCESAEGVDSEGASYHSITGVGDDSHLTQFLYGGDARLINPVGLPFCVEFIDTVGEPTVDLRSNIAEETRAKFIYERSINLRDDPQCK